MKTAAARGGRVGDDGSQTTTATTMIGHESHASLFALAQVELRLPGRLDLGHAGVLRIEAVPDLLGTIAADLARRGAASGLVHGSHEARVS